MQDDQTRLIRQAFGVYVVVASASIAVDLAGGRAQAVVIGAYRAIGVVAAIVGALILRRWSDRGHARIVVPIVIAVAIAASVLQDRVTGDPYSTLLLAASVCLTVALVMPWSWRDQLFLAAICSGGVLANWNVVHGPAFLAFNTAMTCAASVGVAFILERNRGALSESRGQAVASEARLRQIADNAREVFWTLEVEGSQPALSYISPASDALLGLAPGTRGLGITALLERIHPEDRKRVAALFQLVRHVRDPGALDFRIITPNGSVRHVQARFSPICDATGALVRLGGVLEDVTSERQAAAALVRARDEAQAAAHARTHFLAAMTHEISTPLTAILGTLDLLRDPAASEVQRQRLHTVYTSAQSLHLLLSDILDFSKSEAGDLGLHPTEFDLGELVAGIVQLHAAQARARRVDLRFEWTGPALGTFVGDVGRLRQVLNNLVSNAIKFTLAGEVCVRTMPLRDDRGSVRFEVEDTGIGVPPDQRQRIFEPFRQGDESIARRFGGTGLGLAIAARVVEAMGGEIGVESGSRGSRFWFTAPLGTGSFELPSTMGGPSKRVLVVASGAATADLAAANRAFRCWTRADPEDAAGELERAAAANRGYDVVLLVAHEAAGPPESLVRALLSYRQAAPVPAVVILASRGRDGDALVACAAGAAAWLPLPVRPAMLVETLEATSAPAGLTTAGQARLRPAGRILVVDDSEIIREVMGEMLRRMGHHCETVCGGPQALDTLQAEHFDAVFLDCEMPGMDGFETAQRIRAAEADRGTRTPIIAFSASAAEIYRERCLAAGMDDSLAKPIRPPALAVVLARWLRPAVATLDVTLVLDRDRLAELSDHRVAAMRRFCDLFAREARDLIAEIARAADGGEATSLGPALHRLRGAAGYIGAVQLERVLARECGSWANQPLLRRLAQELTLALDAFEQSARKLESDLSISTRQ